MGRGLPPTVKDQSRKTRVFNYRIPISTSGRPGRITGTLYWVGSESGGVPMAAIAAMGVVLLAALTLVLVVRRRRKAR
ncbi:MAG: LPXTG cell wall anchor domain-containing protein [Solirubrobacterales bacterium]|jgi:LPXTG-motif cell wall-anchored protein|nr:LPXTG cell wall anchor domain-containing protein [Solirubrobacterales bacterium]